MTTSICSSTRSISSLGLSCSASIFGPSTRRPVANQRSRITSSEPRWSATDAGKLVGDESVEGLVRIEGPDHPVAIPPRVGHHLVFVLPVGVRITRQIQPPASPALPYWGRQKTIHPA